MLAMEADALISKAEGCNVAGLYTELRRYLEPLSGLVEFEGRKKLPESTDQIRVLAKRYVSFLGRLLKVSSNNLIRGKSSSETDQKRADELFRVLKLVIACYDILRPCLLGIPYEIEKQRYWMARRLMVWERFTEAREECWFTLHSLKANIFCKSEKGKKEVVASARKGSVKKKDATTSSLRKKDIAVSARKTIEKGTDNYGIDLYGELAKTADSGLVELVLGLVTDLIICTGESKLKEADEYRKALVLVEQLVPWQRVSDKNTIEKHRSMLFKGLQKCVLFMISKSSYFDAKLTRTFVMLALDNCACSSVKNEFIKVTCRICRQLVSGAPDHSSMVVDICKLTLSTIFKGLQVDETRFASHTIVMRRLLKVKDALSQMVIGHQWGVWKISNSERAQRIRDLILNESWWARVAYVLDFTEPIMTMLRFVDTDTPCLGDVYDGMDTMVEKVKHSIQAHESDPTQCEALCIQVQAIINHRWNKMTTPLHLLAYALSPRYYSEEIAGMPGRVAPFADEEVAEGCHKALSRLFPLEEMHEKVREEFGLFASGLKHSPFALKDQNRMGAITWWYMYGQPFKHLQPFAIKVLSQWQIYGEDEIIDAVEFYCHYCETSSKLTKDAEQFLHAIADSCGQGLPFHLSAALHIYGVGMGFKGFEVSCLGDDGVDYIESEISEVPSCAKNDDKELLSSLVQKIQNMVEEFQKSLGDSEYGKNESVISIFRALEFLSKASAQCVKQEWDFFVANAAKCRPSAWFSSLEQTFLIFSRIFLAVLSCDPIPLEEKKELRRSCQMVLLAATSALKLALMYQKNSQDIFEIIETLTSGDFILVDELKWLSNCTYSIGVRMFNNKRFDLASNPLKMACTAAWRRISCVMNGSLDDCVESESISELICDACAKSVVLIDAAHRSGSPLLKEIIIDFLTQWSSADSRLSSTNSRRALVKHWVKIVCEDSKDMELNEALVDYPTLYEVLTDTSSTWHLETLGVLLEEELLAYASIETNFSRLVQKRIFKLLLEDVYVTKEFALERSRVLLEQCKAARLIGSDGLDKCMDCLSDAMSLLKKELDENLFPSGKSYRMDCVRHQLAITYCVHACCIQELKSHSKVILGDISSALKLWSCIFSSELLDSNKEQKDWMFDTSIPLLISISQLLALKGFVSLQSEVQGMILQILSAVKKIGPEECCALLWRESRLNHTICCVPFSASIFSTLIDKVGNAINSLRFWENSLNDHLGCLLEFQQKLMCDLFIEVQADIDFSADSFFRSLGTNSIELLKDRVLTLASNGQRSIEFSSVTSNLFYILSEKCRTNGKLSEALKYSNEALRIRRRQLQKCFKYMGKEVHFAFNNEMGGFSLEARGSVATNVWSNVSDNGKHEYQTSQWIVLGNYLESLMQLGVLYEMAGAANEAEYVFQEGLNISNAQDLPLCQAAFGSSLGEIHRKCHKWEIAEKRFQEAIKVLGRPDVEHLCKLCKVTIEATLEMRIGDLVRRCPRESFAVNFYKELTSAFDIYMLAKEKLNYIKRNYSDDMPLDRKMHTKCFDSNSRACKEGNAASSPELESDPILYSVRKSNKTDSMQELLAFSFELHWRSLMSRLLLQIGKCHETSGEYLKAYEIMLQNSSLLSFHIDGLPCLCSFVNGHHCQQKCPGWKIPVDILLFERAALLYHISWFCLKKNFPVLSWTQCCSPSENLRSFVIGWLHHAFFICNQMPALLRKVSILLAIVHMPLALGGLCSVPEDYNSNLSGSHWSAYFHQASLGTTLREEHLAVLDAKLASQDSDSSQASQHNNPTELIERVQKVLRLTPDKLDYLEPFVTDFFRRVPLPTIVCISFLDCRYASILESSSFTNSSPAWIFLTRFDSDGPPVVLLLPICSTFNGIKTDAVEGSNLCSPFSIWNLEADDLKANNIRSTSEVMDVVAEEFHLLLEESRLSTSDALSVATNDEKTRWWQWRKQLDDRLGNLIRGIEDSWLGPWKFLLLGKPSEAAYYDGLQTHMPDLKSMVYSAELNAEKEDYFPVDTLLKALLYGIPSLTNNEIEKCICCLLLKETVHGSISSHSILEGSAPQDIIGKAAKELSSTFQHAASRKNHYKIYDNEPRKSSRKQKKHLRDEGSTECTSSESFLPCNFSNDFKNSCTTCIPREPVVLVLDANSQVLPWESLPIFWNQEVYRMPSVGSISAVMISRGHEPMVDSSDEKEKKMSKRKTNKVVRKNPWSITLEQLSKLPVMDPYNAFYLLNPSGDLSNTQSAFEDWFKNQQGWQGKSGEVPTPEECILALQKHDLFIYLGHGRGEQYIPEKNIKRLDYCAAVVLMGCSSGRLSYKGDYEPVGVPLSYLIAGCPCIIANLWDVTDGDIDRFSRVLLHSWLEAKSSQCNDLNVAEDFKNLKISSENTVKRVPRTRQILKDDKTKSTMDEVRTGSCIGECRGTCKLPYLIGASPVCYGIPTTIKHK